MIAGGNTFAQTAVNQSCPLTKLPEIAYTRCGNERVYRRQLIFFFLLHLLKLSKSCLSNLKRVKRMTSYSPIPRCYSLRCEHFAT